MADQPAVDPAPLFQPFRAGALSLRNRIVMAPLTRTRSGQPGDVPTGMMATYYRQRASAGLIVSEATQISPQGKGYAWTPGIHSPEQVAGWRLTTDAVHAEGGSIVLQLWHVGRISHPSLQPGGALPVAPSAVRPAGQAFTEEGTPDFVTPRALAAEELTGIAADYARAARNAIAAGFDGVEIHGAHGYLLDQFLRDGTNRRCDAYGGSVENRLRFPLEVVDAVTAAIGAARTGIRLSPVSPVNDMSDGDPAAVFFPLVERLARRGLAYVHVVEGDTRGPRESDFDFRALRRAFGGAWIANNGYDRDLAARTLEAGDADLIAFGRPFIANPDLVERFRTDAELNTPDPSTFYGGGEKGYVDYPVLALS